MKVTSLNKFIYTLIIVYMKYVLSILLSILIFTFSTHEAKAIIVVVPAMAVPIVKIIVLITSGLIAPIAGLVALFTSKSFHKSRGL